MRTKEEAAALVAALKAEYPGAQCSLDYADPWQLLVSVRLAAQCTDKRVNEVTPALFAAYPDAAAMAAARVEDVEALVRTCGFHHTKAQDLCAQAKMLVERFGGRVPDSMEELLQLPGVGRKSANLILGDVYGKPAVVADTHCIRLAGRMGLAASKDPVKVEFALREVLDPAESNDFCHRLVLHGRAVCTARKAMCEACCLRELCPKLLTGTPDDNKRASE